MVLDWLARLEARLADGDEEELAVAIVSLAYAGGERIDIPVDERRAAGRRATLLLAAGGDPGRGLDLDGRAVASLAAELETEERRRTLVTGLGDLLVRSRGYPHVAEALRGLVTDPEIAWRAFAAALLAEELEF